MTRAKPQTGLVWRFFGGFTPEEIVGRPTIGVDC